MTKQIKKELKETKYIKDTDEKRIRRIQPKYTVAIDLDGTLAKYDGWSGFSEIGEPIEETAELVKELNYLGHTLILYTTRLNPELTEEQDAEFIRETIIEWLREHNMESCFDRLTGCKCLADVYYDDRAVNNRSELVFTLNEGLV